jgi:hypothetical protein
VEKSKILKLFQVNDETYQKICTVIGLKNPSDLSGLSIDSFEKVKGWLDSKECANAKEAQVRFNAEQASRSSNVPSVDNFVGNYEAEIEARIVGISNRIPEMLNEIEDRLVAGVYAIASNVLLRESQKPRPTPLYPPLMVQDQAIALPPGDTNGKQS